MFMDVQMAFANSTCSFDDIINSQGHILFVDDLPKMTRPSGSKSDHSECAIKIMAVGL